MTEKIQWHVEQRNLDELKPHPDNARIFTEKGMADLKKSINSIGMAQPINITPDGTVLSGHARLMALKEQGVQSVDVYVPNRELTAKEQQEVLIRMNANIAGEFDFEKMQKRFSAISHGKNTDSSDEYYTLFPAFSELLIELLARNQSGKKYKVIICPCDSETSVFRSLEQYKDLIGNPRIIYSFWPEKSWEDYFDMDYESEYGCSAEDVLIFTNPPFKGLSKQIQKIKCDYLLFGSNAVSIKGSIHAKEVDVSLYIKNNETYDGNADNATTNSYGRVATVFYSNNKFLSKGEQYINKGKNGKCLLFGKFELTRVK